MASVSHALCLVDDPADPAGWPDWCDAWRWELGGDILEAPGPDAEERAAFAAWLDEEVRCDR